MTDECSYDRCNEKAQIQLDMEEETIPACPEHASNLADGDNGQTSGDHPAFSNGEENGRAAWINTDKNGNAYISVKIEDGDYENLFPQTDLLQDALNRQHQVTQNGQ